MQFHIILDYYYYHTCVKKLEKQIINKQHPKSLMIKLAK